MYKNLHLKKYDNTKFFCCPSPFKTLAPQSPPPSLKSWSHYWAVSCDDGLIRYQSLTRLQFAKKRIIIQLRVIGGSWKDWRAVTYSGVKNYSTPPAFFPLTSIVNKSRKIECCINSMLPINQNMIVSQGLELMLSIFKRTTMSGQYPLI